MMKQHLTQKLFWKKWPYKAIVEISTPRSYTGSSWSYRKNNSERTHEFSRLKEWFNNRFPEAGIRCENHLSVFLVTEEELNEVIEAWGSKVIDIWKPASDTAKELLVAHEFDVVRARPWYGKFPIRARIPYNNAFRKTGVYSLKDALTSIDGWHCSGLLADMIKNPETANRYGWGQPVHLYLDNAEDAAMLRLYCGDYIERFERIRKPE